ncbi:hypothetical protein TSAR_004359, partial [Trichomalopsis sarcophagae]
MYWPAIILALILCAQYSFAQKFINATSVNINQIIDENMADVRRHIRGFRFDPMNVPNNSDNVYAQSTIRATAPIFTTMHNITTTISMDCKINTIQIFNPRLHIEKVGQIGVKMQSSGSFSATKSLVANVAIPYYEEKIQSIAESTALLVATKPLIYVNKNLYKW